jgi:uncharacterized membrane protein
MAAGLGLHAVGFAAQQGRVSIVALLVFFGGVTIWNRIKQRVKGWA